MTYWYIYSNDADITKHLSTANTDISQILKGLRLTNPKNVILSYLKCTQLETSLWVCEFVSLLAVAETKTNSSFPSAQFSLERYQSPYRLDISRKSSGLLVQCMLKQQYHLAEYPYRSFNSERKRYLSSWIWEKKID